MTNSRTNTNPELVSIDAIDSNWGGIVQDAFRAMDALDSKPGDGVVDLDSVPKNAEIHGSREMVQALRILFSGKRGAWELDDITAGRRYLNRNDRNNDGYIGPSEQTVDFDTYVRQAASGMQKVKLTRDGDGGYDGRGYVPQKPWNGLGEAEDPARRTS